MLLEQLKTLHENHLYRTLRTVDSAQSSHIEHAGSSFINFSSNNYLGLATDPRLTAAAIAATEQYGTSSGASRLVTGSMRLHHDLEEKIARFKGSESALLFNSGYQANIGVLSTLPKEGDLIFSDALNHASLIDGTRLSRAKTFVYRHCDPRHLEELLKQHSQNQPKTANRWIVTDSIFSMDGDAAPLADLAELALRYDCWLFVDEAHATGVCGPNGKGLVAEVFQGKISDALSGFFKERLIQMGTLGKALGSFGAYVAGSNLLTEYLINHSRAFIYTTALPPAPVAAALSAIEILETDPKPKMALLKNIQIFSGLLEAPSPSAIFPVILGSSQKALEASQTLLEAGFWVSAIRYPTVARGTERLRVTLMATHLEEEVKTLGKLLKQIKEN